MTDDELVAWAAGYVAGWTSSDELAELDGRPEPPKLNLVRDIERAGRRRMWDLMVLAGEYPDPEEIERRLWEHRKSSY